MIKGTIKRRYLTPKADSPGLMQKIESIEEKINRIEKMGLKEAINELGMKIAKISIPQPEIKPTLWQRIKNKFMDI